MSKTPWYWEDTAMLLLVPAILIFFLNMGMWFGTLEGGVKWQTAALITLFTVIGPAILCGKIASYQAKGEYNDRERSTVHH